MTLGEVIISNVADLAAVILMICQMIRIRKMSAQKGSVKHYFRILSWMALLLSILHLLRSFATLQIGGLTAEDYGNWASTDQTGWYLIAVSGTLLDIFLSTVFLCMWITFLSWFLFEDKAFIRRKFWVGFVPLIIGAVVTGIAIPMALTSVQGFRFALGAILAFFVIRIFYFLIALWLLREYKKQNGYLRFFNPWVFFIPVAAGWLLGDIFNLGFSALGSTLGLLLLYSSICDEERYLDPETGLYNMDFVGYLKGLAGKKRYAPSGAMVFVMDPAEDRKAFSDTLKQQLPRDCEPILRNDREVVVLTNVIDRGPLRMVMEDVRQASDARSDCTLKKKTETTEAFMDRALSMSISRSFEREGMQDG